MKNDTLERLEHEFATSVRLALHKAASALTDAVPLRYEATTTVVASSTPSERSQRWFAVAGAAAVLGVVVGLVVVSRSSSPQSFDSPDRTRSVTAFDLTLDSALLVDDTSGTPSTTDVTVWAHEDGTYLSLVVRFPRSSFPSGLDVTEIDDFPADRGRAWYGEDTNFAGPGAAVASTLWWQRPDGDVWLMRADWYGDTAPTDYQQQLLSWAFGITTPAPSTYLLEDPEIRAVAAERAGESRDRVRTWNYDGEQILIHVIEDASASGLSNIIGRGRPTPVEIASRQGWIVKADESRTVGWEIDDVSHDWATLHIPGTLADQVDEIIRSVVPATG